MIYHGQYSSWRDFEFLIRKYSSCAAVYLSNSKLFSDRPSRSLGYNCADDIRLETRLTQYFCHSISLKTNYLGSPLHVVTNMDHLPAAGCYSFKNPRINCSIQFCVECFPAAHYCVLPELLLLLCYPLSPISRD